MKGLYIFLVKEFRFELSICFWQCINCWVYDMFLCVGVRYCLDDVVEGYIDNIQSKFMLELVIELIYVRISNRDMIIIWMYCMDFYQLLESVSDMRRFFLMMGG